MVSRDTPSVPAKRVDMNPTLWVKPQIEHATMIFAPLDVFRDISETLCIYNMLYATNQQFYQSIFSVLG
jgi:hypothetical protein